MTKLPYILTAKDFPDIPVGWTLTYDEPSASFYRVRLTSQHGPEVEMVGAAELEELVSRCIEGAKDIDEQLRERYAV